MGICSIGKHKKVNLDRCKKLREEVNDHELINAKKDTTRPSNVYYGLNWGYRSDETVKQYFFFTLTR